MKKYTAIAKVLASLNVVWAIFELLPYAGRIDGATGAMFFNKMLVALIVYFVAGVLHQIVEGLSDA